MVISSAKPRIETEAPGSISETLDNSRARCTKTKLKNYFEFLFQRLGQKSGLKRLKFYMIFVCYRFKYYEDYKNRK